MPSADRVLALLNAGHTYETAGRELGISGGLVFMIATGLPADGGDAPSPDELGDKPVLDGSSQHLSNPPAFNPTSQPHVIEWVRQRAARELRQPDG